MTGGPYRKATPPEPDKGSYEQILAEYHETLVRVKRETDERFAVLFAELEAINERIRRSSGKPPEPDGS